MMTEPVDCSLGGDMYYFTVYGFGLCKEDSDLTRLGYWDVHIQA